MLLSSWLSTIGYRVRRLGKGRRRGNRRFERSETLVSSMLPRQAESLEQRLVLSSTEWVSLGPDYAISGQQQNIDLPGANPLVANAAENPVTGAVNVVLPHPTNPDILFVGGVNGGVWRTTNATATVPDWEPLTDFSASLSVGAMAFDADDPTGQKLYVALGHNSSFYYQGGPLTGLLYTENALASVPTFTRLGDNDLLGRNLTGIAVAGNSIVVTAALRDAANEVAPGVYRSFDGGQSFETVPELSGRDAFDLVQDPGNSDRLYVGMQDGIYRSDSGGANWENVGLAVNFIVDATTNNIELAIHNNPVTHTNAVYAAIVNGGQLAGIVRSSQGVDGVDNNDNGIIDEPSETKFFEMDLPKTLESPVSITQATNASPVVITSSIEHKLKTDQLYEAVISGVGGNTAANGTFQIKAINATQFQLVGVSGNGAYTSGGTWQLVSPLQPRAKAGSQGAKHLSLVADPTDPFIVYIGGDRQDAPAPNDTAFSVPNSLGATGFTGRLFKGDSFIDPLFTTVTVGVPGSQWSSLTNNGTFSNTGPHADSRELAFDALGRLIEADDVGLVVRTGAKGGVITGVFNAEQILIQSRAHGLKTGDQIRISGVTGKTDANGTFTITVLNSDEFLLDGTDDDDIYTSGGVWGAGDWHGLGMGLQVAEFHDIAYDSLTNSVIAGAQDNGTQEINPQTGDPLVWHVRTGGDGGDVAVDNITLADQNQSIRYSSNQNLGGFQRRVFGVDGLEISSTYINPILDPTPIGLPSLITGATNASPIVITAPGHGLEHGNYVTITGVTGNTAANGTWIAFNISGDTFQLRQVADYANVAGNGAYTGGGFVQRVPAPFTPQFLTPITLNTNNPSRMIVIGMRGVYESSNQGSTLHEIGPGPVFYSAPAVQNAIAYGSTDGGDDANVLYVGLGSTLRKRVAGTGDLVDGAYFDGNITDVVMDDVDPFTIYVVIDNGKVWQGRNLDYSRDDGIDNDGNGLLDDDDPNEVPIFVNITDNLAPLGLSAAEFIPGENYDVLVVGTRTGVQMRRIDPILQAPAGDWIELGADSLPNVPVTDLDYDATDHVLVAATLGRGAWKINTLGTFGISSGNALFETTGGTGDMLTIDLNDYSLSTSFAINSIFLPDASEQVTMSPHDLGYELSVDGEVFGIIVLPENLDGGQTFATGGVFHFLPSLSSSISFDADPDAPGFQGRVQINVGADSFEYSVFFNVEAGFSAEGGIGGLQSSPSYLMGSPIMAAAASESAESPQDGPFLITDALTIENVLRVQQRLANLGFRDASGKVPTQTGSLNQSTIEALRLFQSVVDPFAETVPSTLNLGPEYKLASGQLDRNTIYWLNNVNAPAWVEVVDPDPFSGFTPREWPYPLRSDAVGWFDYVREIDPNDPINGDPAPNPERFTSSWVANTFLQAALEVPHTDHVISFPQLGPPVPHLALNPA